MKKLPVYILMLVALAVLALPACHDSDTIDVWTAYTEWREANEAWLKDLQNETNADGTPYYTVIIPKWNPKAMVLIHYFNDRSLTEGNLSPLSTSTIDSRYYMTLYDGTPVDSSYRLTTNGPGIFRTQLTSVISGWSIAFQEMRVGDTAELIIPYDMAYGASTSLGFPPYSNLKYNVSLVGIPAYEINPDAI